MEQNTKNLVVYTRGVVSDEVGKNIVKVLGLAAAKDGLDSQGFGRYGDSPERVFIPTSAFIRIGTDLEQPPYALKDLDVVVVMDETLLAHNYVLRDTRENAFVIINTKRDLASIQKFLYAEKFKGYVVTMDMRKYIKKAIVPEGGFFLGNIKGELAKINQNFTGDDVFPPLGAIAKTGFTDLTKILNAIDELYPEVSDEIKEVITAVYNDTTFQPITIENNMIDDYNLLSGINKDHWFIKLDSYKDLPLGLAIPAVPKGKKNANYKTFDVRPYWPVVDYNKCTRCELCWIWCPDAVIDYDIHINYDYCKGCGICERMCPVQAITMVNELDAVVR